MSGILVEERDRMRGALDAQGFRVIGQDEEDSWWTVSAKLVR